MKKERHLIYINTEYIHIKLSFPSLRFYTCILACLFDLVYTLHWIFIAINFEDYFL